MQPAVRAKDGWRDGEAEVPIDLLRAESYRVTTAQSRCYDASDPISALVVNMFATVLDQVMGWLEAPLEALIVIAGREQADTASDIEHADNGIIVDEPLDHVSSHGEEANHDRSEHLMDKKRGLTRTVWIGRKWVVKVPSLRAHGNGMWGLMWSLSRGIAANLSERESSHLDGVCPVVWSAWGFANVYRRAEPPPTSPIDYVAILGRPLPVDAKPENVGVLGGKLVWIDYDTSWNDCRAGCARVT